jgi:hypothetical protein
LKNHERGKGSHGGHGGAENGQQCLWTLLFKENGVLCTFILPAVATLHIGLVPKMAEMLQTEADPGTIDQNSLRDHRDLRAMIPSVFFTLRS